jgi:predicted cupin superfamily sugar epimerase
MTAAEIIALLDLAPHPEGGWYRQTFVDDVPGGRARSTLIYFLLEAGNVSHWHRVDSAEVWHWYAGAPLQLDIAGDARAETIILGNDLAAGQRPQGVVPPGAWQSARSLGKWTLVGCTVAPGFDFAHFELAPPAWSPPRT